MARTFDGVDDRITFTPAARQWTNGACLAAWVYRAADSGAYEVIYFSGATSLGNPALFVNPSDLLEVEWNGGAGVASTITVPVGEWVFVAATKNTGTVTTTFYLFSTSTMSWTTNTPAGTEAQPATTARTNEWIGAHGAASDFWEGDILCVGSWGYFATQQDLESLVFGSFEAWIWFHPVGNFLYLFDQASTSDTVRDYYQLQHQSGITGTSVSTRGWPPFFGWNSHQPFDHPGTTSQNITLTAITNTPTYNGIQIDPEQVITPAGFTNTPTYNGIVLTPEQVIDIVPVSNTPTYNGIALSFATQTITPSGFVNTPTFHGINMVQEQPLVLGPIVNTPTYHGIDMSLESAVSNVSVWNGTAWVSAGVARWNGSSWVASTADVLP